MNAIKTTTAENAKIALQSLTITDETEIWFIITSQKGGLLAKKHMALASVDISCSPSHSNLTININLQAELPP